MVGQSSLCRTCKLYGIGCFSCENGSDYLPLIICPRCQNAEIIPTDNYCKICGVKLKQ